MYYILRSKSFDLPGTQFWSNTQPASDLGTIMALVLNLPIDVFLLVFRHVSVQDVLNIRQVFLITRICFLRVMLILPPSDMQELFRSDTASLRMAHAITYPPPAGKYPSSRAVATIRRSAYSSAA